jgi:tetratricopeptide (TPR) repeat protein
MKSSSTLLALCAATLSLGLGGQDVDRVRALYVAAAYEEALAAIPEAAPAAVMLEVEQYRALCLLALGRDADAVSVVETIVRAHPAYSPSSDVSPRLGSLFAVSRARLLPSLARGIYGDGKAAFDEGRYEAARETFRRVMGLLDSLPAEQQQAVADLRVLASGFLDLAEARIPPPPTIEKIPSLPPPMEAYVGPVAVQEELPPWTPPSGLAGRAEYAGVFRILIGADGRVTGSEVLEASHPVYDAKLLRAASGWLYRPATRDGRRVPSVKDIQIRLVPR